ncbi:MAG: bifunctional methylenetetrahydrofolate dehydrogenase/methenyltetrahydrofolate cyclohydrolase FolD [Symbiobacteriia bacterium]
MSAQIIDGKAIAADLRAEVAQGVARLKAAHGFVPGLTVVLVGEDPASQVYVRNKEKAATTIGMNSQVIRLDASTSQQELLALIAKLNADPAIHGILVQLPIPDHIDENAIILAIDPAKDVDCFHPVNVGRLYIGQKTLLPCTPAGIIELLDRTGIELKGKRAVVVGRSNIVGKPAAMMLLARHATVTICHSRTTNLAAVVREGDVVVAAVGKAKMITGDMIKPGAAVIDVGTNRVDEKLVGDVDYEAASQVAGYITPVPGGVGPMTIAMLMKNALAAAEATVR